MNGFLIPANSKKSMLIFGLFRGLDLIILAIGLSITLILLLTLNLSDIGPTVIAVTPGAIAIILVFPVAHYHNVLTVILSIYRFFTSRERFIWRGWCFSEEFKGSVDMDPAGYIAAGEDGKTNVPGIFAAGDVRTKALRQIVTAVADGANCVASVEAYLNGQN